MTPERFVSVLEEAHPRSANLVRDHLADNDELLIHLLMPDLLRLCVAEFHEGSRTLSHQLLTLADDALRDGDRALKNAVLVSFVEHAGKAEGETPEFMATWPRGLLTALEGFEES